jgi:hypothetical protein
VFTPISFVRITQDLPAFCANNFPRLRHTCRRSCVHPHQSDVHTNFHLPPPLASLRSLSGPTISLQSTAATLPKSKNNGFARNSPACWLEQQTSSSRNSSCLDWSPQWRHPFSRALGTNGDQSLVRPASVPAWAAIPMLRDNPPASAGLAYHLLRYWARSSRTHPEDGSGHEGSRRTGTCIGERGTRSLTVSLLTVPQPGHPASFRPGATPLPLASPPPHVHRTARILFYGPFLYRPSPPAAGKAPRRVPWPTCGHMKNLFFGLAQPNPQPGVCVFI